jgi:hypothetical protein
MQHRQLLLHVILLLIIGVTGLHAQEAISAAGGDATGSGGSVSYTIGQVGYTSNTGIDGSVAEGVQQPFEISTISGIEEARGINLNCLAYPNPTAEFLFLKVDNYNKENLWYKLYDITGRLLENRKIVDNETTIDMIDFLPAAYFLKVLDNDKVVKTFKIVKQ